VKNTFTIPGRQSDWMRIQKSMYMKSGSNLIPKNISGLAVHKTATKLTFKDTLGLWRVRLGINRKNYMVEPGIYCTGNPDSDSYVFVSANYKLSFDNLRNSLDGINAWILVLDTKGVNVWCAAGKGTFGTDEIINKIKEFKLGRLISHKTLIVPQLSATGVSAHDVLKLSGYRVIFGPVRAQDISKFLKYGMKATKEMRTVSFGLKERAVLIPVEFVGVLRYILAIIAAFIIFKYTKVDFVNLRDTVAFSGAFVMSGIIVPLFLPWIPGRAFSLKGFFTGIIWALAMTIWNLLPGSILPKNVVNAAPSNATGTSYFNLLKSYPGNWLSLILLTLAYLMIIPAISAFFALNFTVSSAYTSLSGVKKEMKITLPYFISALSLGAILLIIRFLVYYFIL
jgi:hypothetical protein